MAKRRSQLCTLVTWPVVVVMGVALLFPSTPQFSPLDLPRSETRSAQEAALSPPSTDSDPSAPSLERRHGDGLPLAGLRPDSSSQQLIAPRSLELATGLPHLESLSRWPHLVSGHSVPGLNFGHLARSPLHVLLCVWRT